ncbi:MAG: FecR family protein [Pseudohongiellaceae bacterium]
MNTVSIKTVSIKTVTITTAKTGNKPFVRYRASFNQVWILLAALVFSISVQAQSTPAAGTVSLVLGKAYLISAGQPRRLVELGSEIHVGEKILTQSNGHVHVHFVDEALLSVRPDSELEILSYQYDAASPEQSLIKFNLLEGVTRAISGEGAKAARSRFRLNTPIAAIGVRGTDFVVSATRQTTRALVNQGAIIMAPYSAECTVAAIGPCAENAVELSGNSLQIMEFEGNALTPRLIPAPHEREPGSMRDDVQLALAEPATDTDGKTTASDIYLENVSSREAAAQVTSAIPEFTPDQPLAAASLTNRQLVWGRWTDNPKVQERITLSYAEASANRRVTIVTTENALFRTESLSPQIDKGLGPVSFALDSAQAFYDSSSGIVAMQVNRGSLDIDFDRSLFSTQLNLNHISTGFVDFNASGSISERGYFNAQSPTQRLAGAVSQDGTEAGYFFQQQLEHGNISGLTLWDSQ